MRPSRDDFSAIAFGTMDGVINVLGILLGVYAATHSTLAVVAAVVAGGVANGIANAAGLHVSKEVAGLRDHGKIFWIMLYGFLATFITGIVQVAPFFFLPLDVAIYLGAFIGLALLALLGYATEKNLGISLEYVLMGLLGGVLAYSLGTLLNSMIMG